MENKGTSTSPGSGDQGLDTSWLSANQDLLK